MPGRDLTGSWPGSLASEGHPEEKGEDEEVEQEEEGEGDQED